MLNNYCHHGHEFTPENTYHTKRGRICKTCHLARMNKYEHNKTNKDLSQPGITQLSSNPSPDNIMTIIIYALFSEDNNHKLKMDGPLIHLLPIELSETRDRRLWTNYEIKAEIKYLSDKFEGKTPIFKYIEINKELTQDIMDYHWKLCTEWFEKKLNSMKESYEFCSKYQLSNRG